MEPVPPPWELSYFRSLVPERGLCHPQARVDLAPHGVRSGLLLGLAQLCAASTDQRGAMGAPCGIWGPWLTQPLCCECQSKGPCDGNSRILALKKVPHKRCPHGAGASGAAEVCRSNHVHPNLANTLLPT